MSTTYGGALVMSQKLIHYTELLGQIKQRIRQGQTRAVFAANTEMILTYWDIGRMILYRQERKGWGASVIPRLSLDIRNEFPEVKGFSERNIGRMIAFYRAYPALGPILPQAVAKSQRLACRDAFRQARVLNRIIPTIEQILAAGGMERPKAHEEAVPIAIPNKEELGDAGHRG